METKTGTILSVRATIQAPVEKTWTCWTVPEHITRWNQASPDWHCPSAVNDCRPGGRFSFRMEAKDGSMGFDFSGTYDAVNKNEYISYTLDDGRKVAVHFSEQAGQTEVTENFEAENMHAHELQQTGWQAILDQFKKYAESC